jgi:hypothetical protein
MTRWRPRTRAVVTMLVLVGASACPRPLPPPPPHVAKVAVLPPVDRTGDGLLVAGGSLLERYAFHSPRVTVPDLLAAEAREWLRTRGVALVGAEAIENDATLGSNVATLRLDVWRWEPDSDTQPVSVLVGLEATLVDVASGRTVWRWRPPPHPIPTPGAVTLAVAHAIAARAAVAELLASWPTRVPG